MFNFCAGKIVYMNNILYVFLHLLRPKIEKEWRDRRIFHNNYLINTPQIQNIQNIIS